MKIPDRIALRAPLKPLALACAVALGLGAGISRAAVVDIPAGTGKAIDTLVGAGNTGRLTGTITTNATAITKDLDLNENSLTLLGNSNGAISGNGIVIVSKPVGGSTGNTYTGTTTVTTTVSLTKTVGNALCGEISVAAGATVNWGPYNSTVSANNQIADDANVTLTSSSRLMLYAYEWFPNQAYANYPVNSDTIGELHVATGAKVYTGIKSGGWGGCLRVTELYIDDVKQAHGIYTEDATGSGLVRGNGWIEVGRETGPPSGPAPTKFKLDGAGGTASFYLVRQITPPITGLMIGNCVDNVNSAGFTGSVDLNGYQLTIQRNNSNGAIFGSGTLVIAGGTIGGSTGNTYTGTTTLTSSIYLHKTVGNALCSDFSVPAGATVYWGVQGTVPANDQIADNVNVTLTNTSRLMLYSGDQWANTVSGSYVNSDTIGKLYVTSGAKVYTGVKASGWGGVLSVSELWIDSGSGYEKQPNVSVTENALGNGLVRGNGYIQVGGSTPPTGPPTTYKIDGVGGTTFWLSRQVVSGGIPGVMIGNCADSVNNTGGFTGSVNLNGYQLTLGQKAGIANNGAISGAGALVIAGTCGIGGSIGNNYTGTTAVTGAVTLNKTVGNALCGNITVNASSSLTWTYVNQISDLANMTLATSTAALNLSNKADTLAALTLATGALVNTGIVTGGVLTVSSLTVGGTPMTGGPYTSSNSTFVTGLGSVVVAPLGAAMGTSTAVASSLNPSAYGDAVTFTATITPTSGAAFPTGTVQFKVDGVHKGSAVTVTQVGSTSNGTAVSVSIPDMAIGTGYVVTAEYSPDGNFVASIGTLSPNQEVTDPPPPTATTTTVVSSQNPSFLGDAITFTATIVPASGSRFPGGTVQFKVDGTNKGSAITVVAGSPTSKGIAVSASVSDIPVGASHAVTAVYSPSGLIPSGNFVTSTGTLSLTVNDAFTGTRIAANTTRIWNGTNSINNTATDVIVPATSSLMLYENPSFPSENYTGNPAVYSDTIGKLYVTTGAKVWTGAKTAGWGGVLSVTELWIDGVQQPNVSVVENADGSGLVRGNGWIQVGGSAAPTGDAPTTFKLDGAPTNDFYIARQVQPPMQAVLIADISNSQYSSNSYPGGGFGAALQLNGHAVTLNNGGNNSGAISGNGAVRLVGSGTVNGSTGSAYTGTTTVSAAWTIAKTAGNALCGDISVAAAASLTWSSANQISDTSNMALTASTAALNLNGHADTLAALTLAADAKVNTGGAGGVLTVSSLTVGGTVMIGGPYTFVTNPEFVTGDGSVVLGEVIPPVTTITTVVSSNYTTTVGDPVTFTATIAPASGSAFPAGTVQFKVDGVNKGSAATVTAGSSPNGTAVSASITDIAVGSAHVVTAEYTPDGNFVTSTGTLSPNQTVNPSQSAYDLWGAQITNGKAGATQDSDGDAVPNFIEFAFNGNPNSAASTGMIHALTETSADHNNNKVLVLTIAVRTGTGTPADWAANNNTATIDGLTYTIEGGTTLGDFSSGDGKIFACAAPVTTGLPLTPGAGYEWRSFILNSSETLGGKGFMRAMVVQD